MKQWTKEFVTAVLQYAVDNQYASFAEIESRLNGGFLSEYVKGLIYDVRFSKKSVREAVYEFMLSDNSDDTELTDFVRGLDIEHPVQGNIKFNLYPFQKEVLEEIDKYNQMIVCKSRQVGMSKLSLAYLLWYMKENANKVCFHISFNHSNAKNHRETFMKMVRSAGLSRSVSEISKTHLKLKNNSEIYFASGDVMNASCSQTIDFLIIDEAAYVPEMYQIWTAMSQTLVTTNSKLLVHSTPTGRDTWFYDMWSMAGHSVHKRNISWQDMPLLDLQWRQNQNHMLGIKRAQNECDGKFA